MLITFRQTRDFGYVSIYTIMHFVVSQYNGVGETKINKKEIIINNVIHKFNCDTIRIANNRNGVESSALG